MKNLIRYITSRIFRSGFLGRLIFRIDFAPLKSEDYYFDVTTPVLVGRAAEIIKPNSRVLDMGTGAACVAGLSLWKRLGCRVTASDINPDVIALAEESVRHNKAPIRVVNSRFFDSINETFDFVIFNPPYVPTGTGEARDLSEKRRFQWNGGSGGTKVIEGFLDAFRELGYPVTALMGINFRHVARGDVLGLLKSRENIFMEGVYRHPILPVDVYTLGKR